MLDRYFMWDSSRGMDLTERERVIQSIGNNMIRPRRVGPVTPTREPSQHAEADDDEGDYIEEDEDGEGDIIEDDEEGEGGIIEDDEEAPSTTEEAAAGKSKFRRGAVTSMAAAAEEEEEVYDPIEGVSVASGDIEGAFCRSYFLPDIIVRPLHLICGIHLVPCPSRSQTIPSPRSWLGSGSTTRTCLRFSRPSARRTSRMSSGCCRRAPLSPPRTR